MLTWIAIAHAIYFGITGIWPIVHMKSFIAVTGPKTDLWLVKAVGALVTAIAAAVGVAAMRRDIGASTIALAVLSCAALCAIDVIYVMKGTIARIYLADAAVEVLLIAAWTIAWVGR
jgi:hypothetical protein